MRLQEVPINQTNIEKIEPKTKQPPTFYLTRRLEKQYKTLYVQDAYGDDTIGNLALVMFLSCYPQSFSCLYKYETSLVT